ncbi:probable disease resistance protein At4g27220 [Magnolia sinica]|uniref:probable disease resistance protein At4g27220 n=1 Tax=Magnolia sinica TaxID=86752 RepID=UPI002659C294|nr:probable disease resistance protein At4g27220 [Magnolia sinica]
MALEICGTVWQIGKDVLVLVKNHVGYLVHYKRNIDNFKDEVESLRNIKNDVQAQVNAARRRRDRINDDVEAWLTCIQKVEADVTRLEDGSRGSEGCFSGWRPNCFSQYNLGKESKQNLNHVKDLQSRGRNYSSGVSHDPPPPSVESMLADGDYMVFESRKVAVEEIMKALKDEAIGTIGVYGMGGVGKTTLMKEMGKQVKNMRLYDDVVMVEVAPNPDLTKIQGEIAGQLGLKLKEKESEMVRKGALLERLQDTKTLVILDNVWKKLELVEIGIPCGHIRKGCKIMLTTRNADVCNMHGSQAVIEVGFLTQAESWNLFTMAIDGAVDSSILHDYGKDIVNECGCVPLLIVAIGTALRHKGRQVWADALTRLRKGTLIETEHREVFSCLELSYDYLETDEIKSCFLFCCLFPEGSDIEIEMLMRYGFGEQFFDDVETLNEARERMHSTIDKLKARCLLLDGDTEGRVKMHDIVRDVARSIASRVGNGFFAKADVNMRNWPRKEKLNECKRISLIEAKTSILPVEPDCPNLLTLLLQKNMRLEIIPDSFFQGMKSLTVIDLSDTRISSLPRLTTLRALFLSGCSYLRDVSPLGEMEKLEILCLNRTDIMELPEEVGRLSNLKLLDLSNNVCLERVGPNLISRLQYLEELHMGNSFSAWEVEGMEDGNNASLAELASLECLTALYIHVKNVECLSQKFSLSWTNISRFRISIAEYESKGTSTSMRSTRLDITKPVSNWVKVLMERSEQLKLVCSVLCDVERWEEMFHDGLPPALEDLRLLKVYNWAGSFFPPCLLQSVKMEQLKIKGCQKMEKIIPDENEDPASPVKALLPPAFENLQFLTVRKCSGLKNLLSWTVARALQQLKELSLGKCDEMESIITDRGAVDTSVLPLLQVITLSCMPKLRSFCEGEALLELPSLLRIEVLECFSLKRLALAANSASSLRDMIGESKWFAALEWADEIVKSRFHDLYNRPQFGMWARQFTSFSLPAYHGSGLAGVPHTRYIVGVLTSALFFIFSNWFSWIFET